jgi:hypothetical protein
MEADKPSGPIATVPDSTASSNPNKSPASSSYLATTVGATTAPPPLHPLQLQALHNAHPAVMDLDTTNADDRSRRATSVISMDDLEAAQALEGLRSGMSTPFSLRCLQLGKKTKPLSCDIVTAVATGARITSAPDKTSRLIFHPSRFWSIPTSIATDIASSIARPSTTRAALIATHFFPPAHLLRYQRLRFRLYYLQIILGAFQVRSRVHRAQHWFASREYSWNRRPQDGR